LKDLRLQSGIIINKAITIRNRTELSWYNNNTAPDAGSGFLAYMEAYCKPAHTSWQGNMRLQYFETDGYDAGIYTYEDDVPDNFSVPFYYDKGFRYYFNVNWDASSWVNKKRKRKLDINLRLKWAQTVCPGKTSIGSYLGTIHVNHHSEIKCQLILVRCFFKKGIWFRV
jgi:hypothetical protein